ncbi:hypothetical protein [Chlorobium sp. N1]|uniref:hypothetical protein n=1 Tax=Chlorobium sp. N1 TaxID=2491138 RepID=UPI0010408D1B|nr:hypothetical protein [Chlorobium sp. N1]TCD47885.1 hypothetical protein E0L29_06300 [Chlorobium sp. N1]
MARAKKGILDRYARGEDGSVLIEVAAPRVEDLYADFDKRAPYCRKDLDDDLTEYLVGCVREIGRSPFMLRFTFDQPPAEELLERVRSSLNTFFMYRRELELEAMRRMLKTSILLLLSGLVLLVLSLWVPARFDIPSSGAAPSRILVEGLTIAAWVSVWEALVRVVLDLPPQLRRARRFRRIAAAPLLFGSSREPAPPFAAGGGR